jgi:ABC-type antimicrobial peptide transport system permease subunit
VTSLFLRQGLRLVLTGVAVGAVGGLLVPLTLPKAIVGLHPIEPLSLIVATLLLIAVALIPCWLPARRASRVEPVVAQRAE